MPDFSLSSRIKRTSIRVLLGFALTAATQSIDPASAQELTKFTEVGNGALLPNSDVPKGCFEAGKGICSGKFQATSTSTLFTGVGKFSGITTLDFTKPEVSAIGVCFPQIVTGTQHTSSGDFKFVLLGHSCIPPASAGLSPGVILETWTGKDDGETGAFAHLSTTVSYSGVASPSGFFYRVDGAASGL